MFSLLHTFKGHTKAVTGLRLHPVSGLAISTSLDGFLKVLNLEALNELFSIHMGVGISGMRIINIGMHHHGVLMSTTDATIKLWKITSVCDFFGVTSSKIARLEVFENLEAELESHHRQKRRDYIMQTGGLDLASMNLRKPPTTSSDLKPSSHDDDDHEHDDDDGSGDDDNGGDGDNRDGGDDNTSDDHYKGGNDGRTTTAERRLSSKSSKRKRQSIVTYADGGSIHDKILVTYSTQDLRAFTQSGQLLGRLEPEHVVEGIKDYCVSVYLKLLFCLCDGDRVLVFDLRRFTFPLVQEFNLRGPGGSSNNSGASALAAAMAKYNHAVNGTGGDGYPPSMQQQQQPPQQPRTASTVDDPDGPAGTQPKANSGQGGTAPHMNIVEDLGVCCELVDVGPAVGLRAPRFTSVPSDGSGGGTAYKTDPRGQRVPEYIESYVLIGMKNGAILFLDALNHFEVQMNFQATNGIVMDLKYRRRQRELIVLGKDLSHTFASIRIWRLPDMDFLGEVTNMRHVSCLGISSSLNFFAVGMHDGNVRLFNHDPEAAEVREIVKSGESHTMSVSALCFCDDLRLYFTTSVDGRIKIWDYEKRLIRSIALNLSSCAVVPGPLPGDVIISQNFYLLTVPKRIWNEDDVLETMRAEFEANANEDIPENIIDEIIQQKSQALAKLQHQQSMHHNGGGGGGDDPATTTTNGGVPPPRIRRESQLDGDEAPSDDEQQPSPPAAGAAVTAAGGGLHRPSISDRRSSRHPSKPQVDDPATDDTPAASTGSRNPPPPLLRHGGTTVGGDTLAARKASSSILVTSRRKASMSMARNSMYHSASNSNNNNNGGAAMLPNGLGPMGAGVNSHGADGAATSGHNDLGHRSSFAAHGRKDSHEAVHGGAPNNSSQQQVLESFERELLLPVLQKQQFRFVSGAGTGAGPGASSVSASSSIATTEAWPPQQQPPSLSLVGSDYYAPHQPAASTTSVRFQETQYAQPKPPPSSYSSSSAAASSMRSDVLDVLHPRFVVHEKPPARMVKLEDVDRHLRHLQQRVLQQQQPQQQPQQQQPPPTSNDSGNEDVVDRPQASFGLSPRARLTLMHSSPAQQALHQAHNNPLTDFSSASKRSAFDVAHQQHQQLQAQETMILNMALGMKVSNQYKQHRQSINAVRQQRLSVMNRRLSVMTAGTPGAAAGHTTVAVTRGPLDGMSEGSDEMDDASDASGGRGRSSSIDRVNREELMATKTSSSSTIGSVEASPPVFLGTAAATASGSRASFNHSSQHLKDDGSVDTSVSNAGTVDMRAPERTALLRAQGSVKLRRSVVTFSGDAR